MSVSEMARAVRQAALDDTEKTWFPRWFEQYARFVECRDGGTVVVGRDMVVAFSKHLVSKVKPAWQRLQAVRAIEFYRERVLQIGEPVLSEMLTMLGKWADKERLQKSPSTVVEEAPGEIGVIDENEPTVIQQLRRELRLRHYATRTELAYVGWVQGFLRHFRRADGDRLDTLAEFEIKEFLSDLAVTGRVAATTQNQALSGLLFFFSAGIEAGTEIHRRHACPPG